MALGLVELIKPIPFGGDFRPYFTIQDKDNSRFKSKIIPNGVIMGVTNPLFQQLLGHWPHILKSPRALEASLRIKKMASLWV